MNVLEKILEEIEETRDIMKSAVATNCFGKECECEDCTVCVCERAMEIIRSHMDEVESDGWIPVSERLPEEHDSIFAKIKGTDKWCEAMFEKTSDEVNVTIEYEDGSRKTTTSHTLDGVWKIEKEQRVVKGKVAAWQPLPEPCKGGE